MGNRIRVEVNGKACEQEVEPRLLLVHFLRDTLGLVCDVSGLAGGPADDETLARVVNANLSVADPMADLYASGPYRVELARVYGRRALAAARDRARR